MRTLLLIAALVSSTVFIAGCAPRVEQPVAAEQTVAEPTINGRVRILLEAAERPETVVTAFPQYQLVNQGRASRTQNLYAFTFSTTPAALTDLKKNLENHASVLQALIVK